MYPALFVARELEELGKEVRCHSTTRSPIAVSKEEEYPLHTRYELRSLYDSDRVTYLYDIGNYDCTVIVTDAVNDDSERDRDEDGDRRGIDLLLGALHMSGNQNIYIVRWCEK